MFSTLSFTNSFAQQKKADWSGLEIDLNGFLGKQLKIYPDYPGNGASGFAEAAVSYKCYGRKAWHHSWRFPEIGVSFIYGYHGNNEVLGQSYSLIPHLTLESRDDRKVIVDVRFGTGLAWFFKPYSRLENPDNLIVGSHLTNITYLSVNLRKPLGPYLAIWGGLSFIHYSNGHYQLPNVGLNTPSLNLGLKIYPFGKPKNRDHSIDSIVVDKRVKVNIRLGFGVHEFGSMTKPIGGPKYPVYSFTAYASKRIGKIGNIQAGVFWNYYSSFYDYIVNTEYYATNRRMKASVISVFVGYEFLIGRFGLMWQSGVNVYNPFQAEYFKMNYGSSTSAKLKTWWCNKVGAQMYLLKNNSIRRFNAFAGVYIKSNLMTADFVETSLGVTF